MQFLPFHLLMIGLSSLWWAFVNSPSKNGRKLMQGFLGVAIYLYHWLTSCLGPRNSFLKLMPTTLLTPLKSVAILVRPIIQSSGSKYWSPKNPLPSMLLQHHPGTVTWLSKITITSFSPRLFTTSCYCSLWFNNNYNYYIQTSTFIYGCWDNHDSKF